MKYGGMIGPLAFLGAVALVGFLRTDYSHTQQMVSKLGEIDGTYSVLFNYGGFFINGLAILAFAKYLFGELKRLELSVVAAVLIAIHGLGMFLATWASCDTGCPQQGTASQNLHNLIGAIKFPVLILAILVLGVQLLRSRLSRGLGTFSLAASIISIILMAQYVSAYESGELTGLWQRAFLLAVYAWLATVSFFFAKPRQTVNT